MSININTDSVLLSDVPEATELPLLYGTNSYLLNGVMLEDPTSAQVGCRYDLGLTFCQTDSQEARTQAIIEQAKTGSVPGLRTMLADGSHVRENASTSFVSIALQVGAYLDFQPNKDAEDDDEKGIKILYEGPLVTAIIPIEEYLTDPTEEDSDLVKKFKDCAKLLLETRVNVLVNGTLVNLDEYSKLMSQTAEGMSAAAFSMEDEIPLSGSVNTLETQKRAVLANIAGRMMKACYPSKHQKNAEVNNLGVAELADALLELVGAANAQLLLEEAFKNVAKITSFLEATGGQGLIAESLAEASEEKEEEEA
jgi:small nuclear ribonucleoprotein (snRNP)-like protein